MKKPIKIFFLILVLIAAVFAGAAAIVGAMDADKYRPQLARMLSAKAGRAVKLNGSLSFSLGLSGIRVSVEDASLANPEGASRPFLASMGKITLGIDALPLLQQRLKINELSIENADILLETDAAGHRNWDFGNAAPQTAENKAPSEASQPRGVSLSVDNLNIVNSQIAFLGADGKREGVNISALNLIMRGTGAELFVNGDVNGVPIEADFKTSLADFLNPSPFSVSVDATYDLLHLTAQGKIDIGAGKAEFSSYEVSSRETKISGDFNVSWSGARPGVRGTLNSDHLNLADFRSGILTTNGGGKETSVSASEPQENERLFSNDPLPTDALKAVDAALTVKVKEFPIGKGALNQIDAKLVLSNGNLTLFPVKARIGTNAVDVKAVLDANASPARVDIGMSANGVDLGDLQKLADMLAFMTGKAGADVQLTGAGNTAHDIASSLGGVVSVTAEKGEILTGTAASVSSLLASVFSAGSADDALNCLAARFIVKGGVMTDNGILIDSAASTVAGKGVVNLGNETMKLSLRARSKLVDIGGLIPSLEIEGSLTNPKYSVDAKSIVKNVVGSLMSGDVDVIASSVPEIQTAPAGQNACVYTLDHPAKAASSGILPADAIGKASQKIQNIGNSLVKGLLGQ
jgi:uncharacterized protein involved in outer membrane biogenesis